MLDESTIEQLYKRYPMLMDTPLPVRQLLPLEGHLLQAAEGRVLFEVGSPPVEQVMVLNGSIRVIKPNSQGREILLYRVQPGESCILTSICLLSHTTYPGQGIVEADLTAVMTSRNFFLELFDSAPAFRLHMIRGFTTHYSQLIDLVQDLAFGKLEGHLAAVLLAKGTPVNITHQLLANELGTVREVISRILERWEAQGIVALERGQIRVLDAMRLGDIADVRD